MCAQIEVQQLFLSSSIGKFGFKQSVVKCGVERVALTLLTLAARLSEANHLLGSMSARLWRRDCDGSGSCKQTSLHGAGAYSVSFADDKTASAA